MARGSDRGLGIDWNFPLHRGHINNRGESLIHEIGLRCTCNMEDTYAGFTEHGAHVPRKRRLISCPVCDGSGYIYRQPRQIVGLITGVRRGKNQLEGGWALPGDSVLSVKPDVSISGGDLIVFTWGEPLPDGQVIYRGAGSLNDNKMLDTGLEENEDRLWYNAESSIHCEDQDGNVYSSDGDFVLDSSKIIRWNGRQPQKGKVYTIKYNAYLEWIAFLPPDIRRDRDRDLGYRVGLRKRHVAQANENPAARSNERKLFCDRLKGCS